MTKRLSALFSAILFCSCNHSEEASTLSNTSSSTGIRLNPQGSSPGIEAIVGLSPPHEKDREVAEFFSPILHAVRSSCAEELSGLSSDSMLSLDALWISDGVIRSESDIYSSTDPHKCVADQLNGRKLPAWISSNHVLFLRMKPVAR